MPIKVTIDWQGEQGLENLIRYIGDNLVYGEAQEQIRILGHQTADTMIDTIQKNRVRPDKGSHKLENAITAETLQTVGGIEVGIGNIQKLNDEAPYWEMIDKGATYTTANTHVVKFLEGDKGRYPDAIGQFRTFVAGSRHTILGIFYVDKAIDFLDKKLKEVMNKLGAKFIQGMGK